ncbi:MAG: bifunctional precorrin-2 dehydrogenase/sirohydrochlorin ferrochelatase [Acidobacteriota bacterium]
MTAYYPVYLDLDDRLVVVLGGGEVAEEKVDGLLAAGAAIRVIAPQLNPGLQRLVTQGRVEHISRSYREGDLQGAFLVVSERLGEAVHRRIWAEAERHGIPLNVQDETDYCSFIAAALFRRGDLAITISTSGKAPALAARLRQRFERELGDHYARFLEWAGRLRKPLAERFPSFETRRELWYQLVDSEVLELLRKGEDRKALQRMTAIMGVKPEGAGARPADDKEVAA